MNSGTWNGQGSRAKCKMNVTMDMSLTETNHKRNWLKVIVPRDSRDETELSIIQQKHEEIYY